MERMQADLVIVGSGAAGLAATLAIQEKPFRILLLTKGRLFQSGSTFANLNGRWGLTFADNDREREILLQAIQATAHGTNQTELAAILVEESRQAFNRLRDWGVKFARDPKGALRRVAPCFCNHPLAAILEDIAQYRAVMTKRLDRSRVEVYQETAASRILVRDHEVVGLVAQHGPTSIEISTRAVILACGGNSATFRHHIVEPGLTGDGYHLAREAGLTLHNMAYQQRVWEDIDRQAARFSVAAFFDGRHTFRSQDNKAIALPRPDSDLARARKTHVPISNLQADREFDQHLLANIGTPEAPRPILVYHDQAAHPTQHILPHVQASNGGILIGPNGETEIRGLFAAGEVTTGMHGGDRVGGTMIAATQVFGTRAGQAALRLLADRS